MKRIEEIEDIGGYEKDEALAKADEEHDEHERRIEQLKKRKLKAIQEEQENCRRIKEQHSIMTR